MIKMINVCSCGVIEEKYWMKGSFFGSCWLRLMDGFAISRCKFDSFFHLPFPNHGLNGVGRSVWYWSVCSGNPICQKQSTSAGFAGRAVWDSIKHVLYKGRILRRHARWLTVRESAVIRFRGGKCLWCVSSSSTHSSSWLLSSLPSSDNTHLILSTLWAIHSALPTAASLHSYWF